LRDSSDGPSKSEIFSDLRQLTVSLPGNFPGLRASGRRRAGLGGTLSVSLDMIGLRAAHSESLVRF
jgi:hypothetical protein